MQQKKQVSNLARVLLVVVVLAGLVLLPGLPSPFAAIPVYAFVADGPYTVVLNHLCRSGTKYCGFVDVSGLGQIDGFAITEITGNDQDFGAGCTDGANCSDQTLAIPLGGSVHWQVSGTKQICIWRTALGGTVGGAMCDSYFGSHAWASDPTSGNLPSFPSTTGLVSVALETGAPASNRTATIYVLYNSVSPSPTPTANATATAAAGLTQTSVAATQLNGATETAQAAQTQTPYFATVTEIARQTQTAAPTSTPYPTSIYHSGGNYLQNWDMNIAPIVGSGASWSTFNRVVQSPIDGDPIATGHLNGGSCGDKYYDLTSPVGGDTGGTGSMWQQFQFPGGDMYINFEAQTAGLTSLGGASITNDDNGLSYPLGNIYNPFGSWQTFKFVLRGMSTAHYTLKFYLQQPAGLNLAGQGLAVDNTNARTGYWGNDCTDRYEGGLPPSTQPIPSPTAFIAPTFLPPVTGVNLLNNCGFEENTSSWTNNIAGLLATTGGATGPHYMSLIDFPVSIAPLVTVQGDVWQSFQWPGGTMFASFWLKDGGAVNLQLSNRTTGFNLTYYVSAPASSPTGWTKETFSYPFNTAGQYVYDFHTDHGQAAGIDGATISAGGFAAGPCSSQSSSGSNATQAATQATATAAFAPTSVNQTATAQAQVTQDAIILETAIAGIHQTQTAVAGNSTSTAAAAGTQTAAAQQTATAQGTPVYTATPQPTAIASPSPTVAPVATQPPATQTSVSVDLHATQTAIAAYFETQNANVHATQTALAFNQTAVAQTQTQQASVNGTQQAIIVQTSIARQTGTAIAAQQTATAGAHATQTAQAGATQTANAHATQTALVATSNATDIAGATAQAQATQTAQAILDLTATAQAQATQTAQAIATAAALGTVEVQPRPEPQPYVDCNRPTNPLALADWMDYEVCRVLSWWVWTPDNTQQVFALKNGLDSYEPLGTLIELDTARNVAQAQLEAYDWANTGIQQEDELPLVVLLFPTHVPTGILTGNIDLTPGHFNIGGLNVNFLTTCSLKVGDIFGQAMAAGLCALINWLVATGIMGWVQYLFDVAVWIAFLRYVWTLVTTKLPQMM